MPPVISKDKCNKCGICIAICPIDVLHWSKSDGFPEVSYPEECWHCNSCKLDCAPKAIQLRIPLPAMLLYTNAPKASPKYGREQK